MLNQGWIATIIVATCGKAARPSGKVVQGDMANEGLALLQKSTQQKPDVILGPEDEEAEIPRMIQELSDILPGRQVDCPDIEGFGKGLLSGAEMSLCEAPFLKDEADGTCLVYNFGLGPRDDFVEMLGKYHKNCQVFAFDPFMGEEIWEDKGGYKKVFGENVEFRPWGLWDGESSRNTATVTEGYEIKGKMMTFLEIQQALGHDKRHVSLFRSDCEGCEYGWIAQAMKDDPTMFNRIDQMFIELHFTKSMGMGSWWNGQNGSALAKTLVPPIYHALSDNFMVLKGISNPGHPEGRDTVPPELEQLGVLKFPCCREMNLIHKRLVVESGAKGVARSNRQSFAEIKDNVYGTGLPTNDAFKQCVSKEHVGDITFCRSALKEAGSRCLVYAFGASTDDELKFLKMLGSDPDFAECRVWAMDPTKSEKNWGEGGSKAFFGKNVEFYPWGLYSGQGHRQVTTEDPVHGKIFGQLFRIDEIIRNYLEWEPLTINYLERDRLHKKQFKQHPGNEITLMRVQCLGEQECLTNLADTFDRYGRPNIKQVI